MRNPLLIRLDPQNYILKVASLEEYLYGSYPLIQYKVRECTLLVYMAVQYMVGECTLFCVHNSTVHDKRVYSVHGKSVYSIGVHSSTVHGKRVYFIRCT